MSKRIFGRIFRSSIFFWRTLYTRRNTSFSPASVQNCNPPCRLGLDRNRFAPHWICFFPEI